MATEGFGTKWTFTADADLSTKQFYFGSYTGASKIDIVTTSGTPKVAGVIQNKASANKGVDVMLWGISKVFAASNLTAGDIVGATASGTAQIITSGTGGSAYHAKGQVLRGSSASGFATVVLAATPWLS
mgnify:CR=1 FL=1